MGIIEALRDKQFREGVGQGLVDVAQGASNAAASNLSVPVDVLAWALRKAGVPVPDNPMGGSDWMAQKGLTREPVNKAAGMAGEIVGGVAPFVMAQNAPKIAGGLLNMGKNLAAPATMNKQAGMIRIDGRGQIPETAKEVEKLSDRFGKLLDQAGIEYSFDKSRISPARYFEVNNPKEAAALGESYIPYKVRISEHRNVHGADFSVDPNTGATFEEMLSTLRDMGHPIGSRVAVDRTIGKKVNDAVNAALDIGPGSLISKAVKKYGGLGTDAFRSSPYKSAEQRLYEIYNLPTSQKTKQHLDEVNSILRSFEPGNENLLTALERNGVPLQKPFEYPQDKALETARQNGVKMLGLPENNTAMDRAKALGFDKETFHGTGLQPNYDNPSGHLLKPDVRTYIETADGIPARSALFSSTSPTIASGYATRQEGQVMPLLVKEGKQAWNDAKGMHWLDYFKQHGVPEANARGARKAGYDTYRIKNVIDPFDKNYSEIADTVAVLNPSNMRSRFAAFDPARINENDLLAGALPFTAMLDDETRTQMIDRLRALTDSKAKKK